ncbi:MAG TPA: HEPN domain-containing protein [Thermomicrobiales bacterium]|nr:HEPN domain-containing protein [Thermomicrobiales bacterium]
MQPQYLADADDWLERSERDLETAKRNLQIHPLLGEVVAYHAQQSAEKALKRFLTAYGLPFRKTHLLESLVKTCEMIDHQFQQFTASAQTLSPYAIEFRYPGGRLEPSEAEARNAVQYATDILQFVRDTLANATPRSSN